MKVGTHNGVFHADDVFAVATLQMVFNDVEIVRTRDQAVLDTCDFVVDVGGIHDPNEGRYDHHQKGGAGARTNGVPFSSFGLVWHEFGAQLCSWDGEVMELVDRNLVQSVCAADNGFSLTKSVHEARTLSVSAVIAQMNPTWTEDRTFDEQFEVAVGMARRILERSIASAEAEVTAKEEVARAEYRHDLAVAVLDRFVPWGPDDLDPDCLYVVFPAEDGSWRIQAVPPFKGAFSQKKPLPASWAGKRDQELSELVGVTDAVFCHNGRFVAGAGSKESILRMAALAIEEQA